VSEAAAREAAAREAAAREAAAPAPADWTSPTLGVFKGVPGGTFMLGNTQVTLSRGFWVMEHEVTQGEWQAVMGGNPSEFSSCGRDCPVENVSWEDAQGFVSAVSRRDGVSYRLLTEAEWEWAARGGASFAYAGSDNLDAVGWYGGNSGHTTHPVCRKQRNGYGLCDMSGNVWEWVADWYGGYPGGAVTDPTGAPSGSYRVIRGGRWSGDPSYARVANRGVNAPSDRFNALGFRLSRSVP
jgi:formylglycine-generating enzyme required for sulfatase activity